VEEKNEETLAV